MQASAWYNSNVNYKSEVVELAKEVYKIPYTVDNIRFRALVSLKVGNVGPKKQVYVYQVVGWVAVTILTAAIIFWSPMRYSLLWAIPFGISMFGLGLIGLRTQKNGLPGYRWIKPTFNYIVSKGDRTYSHLNEKNGGVRLVKTNKGKVSVVFSSDLQKLRGMTDLDAISGEATIGFQNGDVGVMYRVSGYTSLVILDQEMNQVIDTIAKWNNSLDPTTSWTLITDHSNQRVINQQRSLLELQNKWRKRGKVPKPIADLMMSRYNELKAVKMRYKSSQQYLLLRSSSLEILDKEMQQLEASTRQGMLKSLEILSSDDAAMVMKDVMQGED